MNLELRAIDDTNKEAVELLEVSDSQKQYSFPFVYCLQLQVAQMQI